MGGRAVAGLKIADRQSVVIANTESPLLQTGLALAGANHRTQSALDEEDGILTAEEIAALNLAGVEWAVLSACDTGLGGDPGPAKACSDCVARSRLLESAR